MKKRIFLTFVMLFVLVVISFADKAEILYKATIYIDDEKAPVGTVVTLKDKNGNNYTKGDSALVINSLSTVSITAYGDDPNTPEKEPGFSIGDKIYFYVNGKKATVDCKDQDCDYFTNPSVPPAPPTIRYVDVYVSSTAKRDTCTFSGTVLIDGEFAPSGTEIRVYDKLESKRYITTTVGNAGAYSIILPGDDPDTPEQDGPMDGDTLVFKINGKIPYVSEGNTIYSAGSNKTVNLQLGLCIFYGPISINSSPAPAGTKIVIKSKADTNVVYDTTVTIQEGNYSISIEGDEEGTSGIKEGPENGEELLFYVNGVQANTSPAPVFYEGGKYTVAIEAEITEQTLCTFIGFNCTLSGEVLPVGSIVKAYKQGTDILCGEDTVTIPGYFELGIKKDLGDGQGASDGDTIQFTFNDIPARVNSTSPNPAVCKEGEKLLITLDATANFCYAKFDLVYNQNKLAAGLQVDAYTSGNIKCGSGIVTENGSLLMMIAGDDPETGEIEGPVEGDTIIFKSHGWLPTAITPITPIYYHKLDTVHVAILMFDFDPTDVEENNTLSKKFELLNPMPNPFNPETEIRFSNDKTQRIKIDIYNMLGIKVKTLVDKEYSPGKYKVKWNGTDDRNRKVPAGVYLIQLSNKEGKSLVKKVSFIK